MRANLERSALSIDGEVSYPFTEEQILENVAVMSAHIAIYCSRAERVDSEVLSRPQN